MGRAVRNLQDDEGTKPREDACDRQPCFSTTMASSSATVSSTLWAHLLRKDKPSTSIQAMSSPIAPADKTGTSVRLLLHDTQATMEKFSEKVDKLISGVQDAQEKSRAKDHDWAEGVDRSTTSIVREAGRSFTVSDSKTCLDSCFVHLR